MDQPWNPAVLEQRAGRVHRLGQHRPVRVVNFVAQGTIEHGMLSLLAFKRSLFAGVLDNGQDQVLLGGTRLNRFMESVETATGAIPAPMPAETAASRSSAAEAQEAAPDNEGSDGNQVPSPEGATGPAGSLGPLIAAGASFLEQLGRFVASAQAAPAGRDGENALLEALIGRDAGTGQAYLKLPMPSEDTLTQIAGALGALAQAFGHRP